MQIICFILAFLNFLGFFDDTHLNCTQFNFFICKQCMWTKHRLKICLFIGIFLTLSECLESRVDLLTCTYWRKSLKWIHFYCCEFLMCIFSDKFYLSYLLIWVIKYSFINTGRNHYKTRNSYTCYSRANVSFYFYVINFRNWDLEHDRLFFKKVYV